MSYTQLNEIERHTMNALLTEGYKQIEIAKKLNRSASTISR